MKFVRDIIIIIVAAIAICLAVNFTIETREVHSQSMLPDIEPGEHIIVSKAAYFFHPPERGEVIVFHSPRNPKSDLIKRIIALPGDTIEIEGHTVFVNDIPLVEPYISESPEYTFPFQEIDADHYFVLGDNRNSSSDSHKGWTVPRTNIVGKAWVTYWPPHRWHIIKHYFIDTSTQVTEDDKS